MTLLALLVACSSPEAFAPPPAEVPARQEAPEDPPVRAPAVVADLHVDTPTQLHRKGLPFDAAVGLEAGLPQLRAGGVGLTVQVLWPPRDADWRAHTFRLLELVEGLLSRPDVALVRSPEQARREVQAGRLAVALALEGAHGLGDHWSADLGALHGRGLAMLGLTWSFSNRFAGSSGDGGGGLTDEGRLLVARSRSLGLLLDLSHASRATTLDVCRGSPVPVVASHSNAQAVHPHARNLTDEEIRCIAATGGVIGLNFHAPFVGEPGTVAQLAAHAEHLARVGGHGVVALGSDWDGIIRPVAGLEDASKLGTLWDALAASGWTEAQLAGVRGENFLRAWQGALDRR